MDLILTTNNANETADVKTNEDVGSEISADSINSIIASHDFSTPNTSEEKSCSSIAVNETVTNKPSNSDATHSSRFLPYSEVWKMLTSLSAQVNAVDVLPQTNLDNCKILLNFGRNLTERAKGVVGKQNERQRSVKLHQRTSAWFTTVGNTRCIVKDGQFIAANPRKLIDGDVVILHHILNRSRSDSAYCRRVCWFWNDSSLPVEGMALVEYLGDEPKILQPHDNASKSFDPYIRTHPTVLQCIKDADREVSNKEMYTRLLSSGSEELPRSRRQIADVRYNMRQKNSPDLPLNRTIADDYAAIYSMMEHKKIIYKYVRLQDNEPWVMLLLPEQVSLIKTLCTTARCNSDITPLAFDRTFNLAPCYVTATVFKATCVNSRRSGEAPIILGPVLLHRKATVHPYSELLRALKDELDNADLHVASTYNVAFRSDSENAISDAIMREFSNASRIFCIQHLRDDFDRYMKDKAEVSSQMRQTILNQAFSACSDDEVASVKDAITSLPVSTNIAQQLVAYYDTHVCAVLHRQAGENRFVKLIPELWTNNNCRSINHVLESSIRWKLCKTVCDVIKVIEDEVNNQLREIKRAIFGEGDYTLAENCRQYAVPDEVWQSLTVAQQDTHFSALLRQQEIPKSTVTSTDGLVTRPHMTSVACKPGHRKRIRSDRVVYSKPSKKQLDSAGDVLAHNSHY